MLRNFLLQINFFIFIHCLGNLSLPLRCSLTVCYICPLIKFNSVSRDLTSGWIIHVCNILHHCAYFFNPEKTLGKYARWVNYCFCILCPLLITFVDRMKIISQNLYHTYWFQFRFQEKNSFSIYQERKIQFPNIYKISQISLNLYDDLQANLFSWVNILQGLRFPLEAALLL